MGSICCFRVRSELNLIAYGGVKVCVVVSQFYCTIGINAAAAKGHGDAGTDFYTKGTHFRTFYISTGSSVNKANAGRVLSVAEVALSEGTGFQSAGTVKGLLPNLGGGSP